MRLQHLLAGLLASAALGAALPASAAVAVIGNGLAPACYRMAEFNGDPSDGIRTCSMALENSALGPKDRASTYVNRGILRARLGDADGALRDYDTGLSIAPDLGDAHVDRGAALIAVKRYGDAITAIDSGLRLGCNKPQIAYYNRAVADEALGDIRSAYQDYSMALQLAPDFQLAARQLKRFNVIRHRPDGGL